MLEVCRDCRFWVEIGLPHKGVCHRHAPQPLTTKGSENVAPQWPLTMEGDWCGEFEVRLGEPRISVDEISGRSA